VFEDKAGTNEGEILGEDELRVEEVGDIGSETMVGKREAPGAKPGIMLHGSSLLPGLFVTNLPLRSSFDVVELANGPVIVGKEGTEVFPNR